MWQSFKTSADRRKKMKRQQSSTVITAMLNEQHSGATSEELQEPQTLYATSHSVTVRGKFDRDRWM